MKWDSKLKLSWNKITLYFFLTASFEDTWLSICCLHSSFSSPPCCHMIDVQIQIVVLAIHSLTQTQRSEQYLWLKHRVVNSTHDSNREKLTILTTQTHRPVPCLERPPGLSKWPLLSERWHHAVQCLCFHHSVLLWRHVLQSHLSLLHKRWSHQTPENLQIRVHISGNGSVIISNTTWNLWMKLETEREENNRYINRPTYKDTWKVYLYL